MVLFNIIVRMMFMFTHQYISEHSDWMYIVLQLLNFFKETLKKQCIIC